MYIVCVLVFYTYTLISYVCICTVHRSAINFSFPAAAVAACGRRIDACRPRLITSYRCSTHVHVPTYINYSVSRRRRGTSHFRPGGTSRAVRRPTMGTFHRFGTHAHRRRTK